MCECKYKVSLKILTIFKDFEQALNLYLVGAWFESRPAHGPF